MEDDKDPNLSLKIYIQKHNHWKKLHENAHNILQYKLPDQTQSHKNENETQSHENTLDKYAVLYIITTATSHHCKVSLPKKSYNTRAINTTHNKMKTQN